MKLRPTLYSLLPFNLIFFIKSFTFWTQSKKFLFFQPTELENFSFGQPAIAAPDVPASTSQTTRFAEYIPDSAVSAAEITEIRSPSASVKGGFHLLYFVGDSRQGMSAIVADRRRLQNPNENR